MLNHKYYWIILILFSLLFISSCFDSKDSQTNENLIEDSKQIDDTKQETDNISYEENISIKNKEEIIDKIWWMKQEILKELNLIKVENVNDVLLVLDNSISVIYADYQKHKKIDIYKNDLLEIEKFVLRNWDIISNWDKDLWDSLKSKLHTYFKENSLNEEDKVSLYYASILWIYEFYNYEEIINNIPLYEEYLSREDLSIEVNDREMLPLNNSVNFELDLWNDWVIQPLYKYANNLITFSEFKDFIKNRNIIRLCFHGYSYWNIVEGKINLLLDDKEKEICIKHLLKVVPSNYIEWNFIENKPMIEQIGINFRFREDVFGNLNNILSKN